MADDTGPEASMLDVPVVLGAGPVGRAVVASLLGRGVVPTVVTRSGTTVEGAVSRAVDLTDADAAHHAVAGATVVFSCVQPPYHRWLTDFRPLQDAVIAACAAAGAALVVVDNVYAYGQTDTPMTESNPLVPTTRKGAVRAAAHGDLEAAHRTGRLRAATVRASDFIGPYVTESAFGERCLGSLARGRPAQLLGPGRFRHSVTFVPDLAAAMVRVAEQEANFGRTWHAPTAPAITVSALIERAAAIADVDARSRTVPRSVLRTVGLFNSGARETVEMLYQFDRDFVVDSSETEAALGVAPTDLDDALAATMVWYQSAADGR